MNRLGSLDILLDDTPPEQLGRNPLLLPLSKGEAAVARFGLNNRFSYYFNKNKQTLTEEERLMAVYNFLADKIDRYRREARNIFSTLEARDESADLAYQTIAVSSIMVAQHARSRGWPSKRKLEEIKIAKLQEAAAFDSEDFGRARAQAAGIAFENNLYWVSQLQKNHSHYIVPKFRRAIAESTPTEIEV